MPKGKTMTFKEYLTSKKIDAKGFALGEQERFMELKNIFDQVHPDSFTAQKIFLINGIRRKYPIVETAEEAKKEVPKAKMMRPKLSITPKNKE
ncbi:conserved hypothetical protein [Imperialibacter sp. 89]|nr:conserved hypothetical protein [Imperialibacter sp. 89]